MAARYYAELLPPYVWPAPEEQLPDNAPDNYHLAAGRDANCFDVSHERSGQ
jgi:hypothetical protein